MEKAPPHKMLTLLSLFILLSLFSLLTLFSYKNKMIIIIIDIIISHILYSLHCICIKNFSNVYMSSR